MATTLDSIGLDLCYLQLNIYCWDVDHGFRNTFYQLVPRSKRAGAGRHRSSQLVEWMLSQIQKLCFFVRRRKQNQFFPYHIVAGHYAGPKEGYNKSRVSRNAFSKKKQWRFVMFLMKENIWPPVSKIAFGFAALPLTFRSDKQDKRSLLPNL